MKKGVIFYITEGKDDLKDTDFEQPIRALGYDAMCCATNEFEVSYWWYVMVTRGVQEIVCRRASYQTADDALVPEQASIRLWG